MSRKAIPSSDELHVITTSRRRCCICFYLHNDLDVKRGQIAHIDRNSSNSTSENLAWLCLDHHDQYDSKTSQSKGFKPKEIKKYRDELYVYFETVINNHTGTGLFVLTEGTDNGLSYVPRVGFPDYYQGLKLISPNGGEVLTKGGKFEIKWENTNYSRGIDVMLVKDGIFQNELPFVRGNDEGEGSFVWDPVDTTVIDLNTLEKKDSPGGSGYRIFIAGQDGINMDISDNTFSIVPE